ncbi:MAG: hypothetical protein EPN72_13380 [Nevskiaceae bacterium]|nr:MAG: hypothetical protein EPN63_13710 [Nevskiaceae bacterium]TBR71463.1 MAG: hypothetical protein EPN72_13380 [Nevskiaceae bacterium]
MSLAHTSSLLTAADEYPVHQTPEPIAVAGSDLNFYDRFWFNAYSADGQPLVAVAMGVYPNLNIMDAAISVVHGGTQYSLFASRLLDGDRMATRVKPISVEVVEPLKKVRVRVDDNEHGIRAELVFTGRAPPIQEPRFTWRMGTRTIMDSTRLTQSCTCEGWIEVAGERLAVHGWHGTRDRSWGVRSVGGANKNPFPPDMKPQFFWLWCPFNGADHLMYFHTNDNAEGEPWNRSAVLVPLGKGEPQVVLEVRAELVFRSGTRHVRKATIRGRLADGGAVTLELEPEWNFYMRGVGYTHATWGHSAYQGAYATHYESFRVDEIDETQPDTNHVQAACRAVLTLPDGRREVGRAMLEQLIIGASQPYGFKELFDLAP